MLDVGIGRNTVTNKIVRLKWDNNIGAFIVGRPGSGKSHVITSLLIQYAIKNVAIAIGEYNADPDNKESLVYRTRPIHHLFKVPYATSDKEVSRLMDWLFLELKQRQLGLSEKTPLVVVLDEFLSFSRQVVPPQITRIWREGDAKSEEGELRTIQRSTSYWDKLVSALSDLRKNNIRIILALQEPASGAGTSMRQVRDMFSFKLIMRLGAGGSKLCGINDVASQRIIETLPTGYVFMRDLEDRIVGVPYPINPEWLSNIPKTPLSQTTISHIPTSLDTYDWTPEDVDLYLDALFARWNKYEILSINGNEIPSRIDTKEDLIRMLVLVGKNNEFITSHVKGKDETIRSLIKHYREQYGK